VKNTIMTRKSKTKKAAPFLVLQLNLQARGFLIDQREGKAYII